MNNQPNHFGDQRQVIDTNAAKFDTYDFGGPVLAEHRGADNRELCPLRPQLRTPGGLPRRLSPAIA